MPAAPAPVLAQPYHDRGLMFRTLAASALRRGMVAFRGRRGSLPEAAHPTVEGSRPGARRHVAHAAVAARPGLGPDESSPACPELVDATGTTHGHHVCRPRRPGIAGPCALDRKSTRLNSSH